MPRNRSISWHGVDSYTSISRPRSPVACITVLARGNVIVIRVPQTPYDKRDALTSVTVGLTD